MNYLIDFKNSASETEIQAYCETNEITVLKTFNKFEKVLLVQANNEPSLTEIVERIVCDDDAPLQLLGNIIIADQNFGKIVTDGSVPVVNIPNDDQNWWKFYVLSDPDLDKEVLTINRRGSESTVYVLDSGINISHTEFSEAQIENLWSFNGNFNDLNGHGTAIASVISGKTCGLTNAKIKSVKIFEEGTPTKQSDLLSALDAIFNDFVENKFNNTVGNAIVNASWSIAKNEFIENKIKLMLDNGIFFVVSAGNDGSPISDRTPASMPEVITVGAYNNNLVPCDFSNYTGGSEISVSENFVNTGELDGWAPGEKIWCATKAGGYGYVAGTSISAGITCSAIAYNLSTVREPIYDSNLRDYFYSFALMRPDLLDLSDPKYSQSINGMVTFRETMPPSFGRTNPMHVMSSGRTGQKIVRQVFSPWQVSKLEILDNLPETWEITPYGKLYGVVPELNPEEDKRLVTIPMKVTYLDGIEETLDYKFLIMPAGVEIQSFGDPELDLLLTATCLPNGPQCINPVNDFCDDQCTMQLVCDTGICPNPKQTSCICIL